MTSPWQANEEAQSSIQTNVVTLETSQSHSKERSAQMTIGRSIQLELTIKMWRLQLKNVFTTIYSYLLFIHIL